MVPSGDDRSGLIDQESLAWRGYPESTAQRTVLCVGSPGYDPWVATGRLAETASTNRGTVERR